MYESIRIQNFRGLKDLTIENLGRVNLLVGANNVGKTSVLEALALLHLHRDAYELGLMLNDRGYRSGESLDGAMTSMFGGASDTFSVDARRRDGSVASVSGERKLRMTSQTTNGVEHFHATLNSREQMQLYYFMQPSTGVLTTTHVSQIPLPIPLTDDLPYPRPFSVSPFGEVALLLSGRRASTPILADLISERERSTVAEPLANQLRVLDRRIVDLFVGFDLVDRQPTLNVKLSGSQITTVVPFNSLGSGSQRLAEILLTVPLASGGIALIDEVESGIYHESLYEVWLDLGHASAVGELQVIASTHSWENVSAAIQAFDGPDANDFRLVRLERDGDEVRAITAEHHQVGSAVALGFDVR